MVLLGSLTEPPHRFGVILGHPAAVAIQNAEVALPAGVALFCGATGPHDCKLVVLLYALAGGVAEAQGSLRLRVPLVGGLSKPRHSDA